MTDPQDNLPATTNAPATSPSTSPAAATQLKDLPLAELQSMAREYGLDGRSYETKPGLVAAILDRRAMVASLDRDAMVDVLHWAGRTATISMSRDRIAMEISAIRSMRFNGLSQRGLVVLARLRGVDVNDGDATPDVISRLKSQESLLAKIGRKRRQMMGKWVSRMLGEGAPPHATQIEDASEAAAAGRGSQNGAGAAPRPHAKPERERRLQDEIEETGLIAGLTSRMRRGADQYLNQKLDEIEARIDRKLDEIDRRLAEWRDKEVANRLRILKVSLWATVVVGAATLLVSYFRVYLRGMF